MPRSSRLVEGQPLAQLACVRPGVDEAVDVRIAPLPRERRHRIRTPEGNVESQDAALVRRSVLVPERWRPVCDPGALVAADGVDNAGERALLIHAGTLGTRASPTRRSTRYADLEASARQARPYSVAAHDLANPAVLVRAGQADGLATLTNVGPQPSMFP